MREMDRERERTINVEYRVSLLDAKDGKVLKEGKWITSKSLVKNFMAFLFANLKHENVNAIDINGNGVTFTNVSDYFSAINADGASGDSSKGIVVGEGSTSVTNDDYALEEQCVHGHYLDLPVVPATFLSQGMAGLPVGFSDAMGSFFRHCLSV